MDADDASATTRDEEMEECSGGCSHLKRAMHKARRSSENGRYDDAVNHYTAAYGVAQRPEDQLAALCGRADAYTRLCRSILTRPARESEERALFALDPSSYAALALQDADAALRIDANNAHANVLRGEALLLLERYTCARTSLMHALFVDPANTAAQTALASVESALQAAGGDASLGRSTSCSQRRLQMDMCDDIECVLCMRLLYEPVTTPCGHSFCKPCFARCTDVKNRCPICRTVLHVGRELPVTVTLKRLLERSFPEEYAARQREECGAGGCEAQEHPPLPLFVMSALLPGERMGLQIFEPRYRLMVRRCMEGNRRFGMAVRVEGREEVEPLATEAEITECSLMPDGRYHLEIVGRRRCHLERTWEQDGYRIGAPRYFCDEAGPCPRSPEGEALAASVSALHTDCQRWVEHLKAASQARRAYRALELLYRAGNEPPQCHPVLYSFWAAALLPTLDSRMRMELMECRVTGERLTRVQQHLQGAIESFSAEGCSVM